MRRRAEKRIARETPWEITGAPVLRDDMVVLPCTCPHHVGGRCAIYAERPDVCRRHPTPKQVAGTSDPGHRCALLDALRRERAEELGTHELPEER